MRACHACPGFVPDHLTSCPHCGARPRGRALARAIAALASGAASLTLMACYGAPPVVDGCPDVDQDGWLPGCYNDDYACDEDDPTCDCNDHDPTVHPGAVDVPGDGRDHDCDGKDGQGPGGPAPDAAPWPDMAPPDAEIYDATPAPPDAAP